MLENVIDVTENCRHSLMCRHVCPVGNLTRLETLTPHGWAQLIASERRGLVDWNAETVAALYACADCGNCRSHCATSQPLPAGIAAARAEVVARDQAPAVVYELAERFEQWENPYVAQAPQSAAGQGPEALFVGDEVHHLRPQLLEAALELLSAVGIEPVLIGRGRSTGYLASSLGLPDQARRLAEATLAELSASGARRLLVLSAGDYFAFSQMHEERLGAGLAEDVAVVEVLSVLAEAQAAGRLSLRRASSAGASSSAGPVYAYVDPTHAVRVKQRYAWPRGLLASVLGEAPRELFWREARAYPSGNLALQFTEPSLAEALTQARLADAASVGATVVVTEDAGSLSHLERHASSVQASSQAGSQPLRVQGLYELLAEHLA